MPNLTSRLCAVWKEKQPLLERPAGEAVPQEGAWFHNEHTVHCVMEKLKRSLKNQEIFLVQTVSSRALSGRAELGGGGE